jgi:hypothetical protein
MTHPLAKVGKHAPELLPLLTAVKRGVTLCMPLKGDSFSPRNSRAILWLCDQPAGGPRDYDQASLRSFVKTAPYRYVIAGLSDPTVYQRAADRALAGENVVIIETDRTHAWEWSEFLGGSTPRRSPRGRRAGGDR